MTDPFQYTDWGNPDAVHPSSAARRRIPVESAAAGSPEDGSETMERKRETETPVRNLVDPGKTAMPFRQVRFGRSSGSIAGT